MVQLFTWCTNSLYGVNHGAVIYMGINNRYGADHGAVMYMVH